MQIKQISQISRGAYGVVRLHRSLQDGGVKVGIKRVQRLMISNGICSKCKRKFKATTDSNHNHTVAANILADSKVTDVNQVFVQDITYISTAQGWLYLMDKRITKHLVISALNMAIIKRKPVAGLICHSDLGSQYCFRTYKQLIKTHNFIYSMSAKGRCYDNAFAESFFHTLKTELVHHHNYQTRQQAISSIFDYIEGFYNRVRMHSGLGYCSPMQFEQYSQDKAA